ncbi:MAG: hypothetical protein R3194_08005, partial [Limnobacter sp.]|nr:hypothetical protein [Limnobacter sp.]
RVQPDEYNLILDVLKVPHEQENTALENARQDTLSTMVVRYVRAKLLELGNPEISSQFVDNLIALGGLPVHRGLCFASIDWQTRMEELLLERV